MFSIIKIIKVKKIKKLKIFLEKKYSEIIPKIKIDGIKKITWRSSSYKWDFFKINIRGKIKVDINNVPKTILFVLLTSIFFSDNGKNIKPTNIINGNFTKNHIGKYVGSRFFENIHFPNVNVHTLLKWLLI